MSEIECIVDLLQTGYNGSPWHGPALMANLDGITAAQAVQRPIPNGHCVWELVQHVTAWINVAINTIDGQQYAILPVEQDWPAMSGEDEAAWQAALGILDSSMEALIAATAEVADDRLWPNVEGFEFNLYWLLMGVVQHNAYHAGQIGLLKKGLI
jgi:hypothetical protein